MVYIKSEGDTMIQESSWRQGLFDLALYDAQNPFRRLEERIVVGTIEGVATR